MHNTQTPRSRTVGALRYELGFPTPETSLTLFDEMDFQRAVQSYLWGYPAVSFESIRLTAKQDFHAAVLAMAAPDRLLGGGHFTPFG